MVVELDRDLAASLAERLGQPGRIDRAQADALKFDFTQLASAGPMRVIGNLPYNISTPLIFHLLEQAEVIATCTSCCKRKWSTAWSPSPAVPMAGCRSWPAITAPWNGCSTCRRKRSIRRPRSIRRSSGWCPTHRMRKRRPCLPALDQLSRTSFGQRRKTLRKSLKGLVDEAAFEAAGIEPQARPETLSLEQFRSLARELVVGSQ
jgi:16S rRNA (adenine1518-N6/adenine1519-N6)-dimethyltransferase